MRGNVLIMAGGTGGHVFPALACAREFQARGYAVHWLGTPRGIENELVPAAGLPLHLINVSGLRGKGKLALFAVRLDSFPQEDASGVFYIGTNDPGLLTDLPTTEQVAETSGAQVLNYQGRAYMRLQGQPDWQPIPKERP